MKRTFLLIFCTALLFMGSNVPATEVKVIKFDTLAHLMSRDSDKIEVINFWATWCKPCIQELPYFQNLHNTMSNQVNVTLISLDYADVLNTKVIPFVKKRQLTAKVLLLDEIDYNSWIDSVDPSWSGAIPATLVINHQSNKRTFYEGALEEGDLEKIVKELIN